MDIPRVSIVTPSYNQAAFLERCIKSVINQDYQNIEYIVIDGGSTDESIDIIKKYEHKLAYWESTSDNGQSHAINKGFKKATGQIVAWLNSDDLYFPDAVSIAVDQFLKQPDLVLFYGDCVFIDTNGGFIRYFTEVEPYDQKRLLNFSDFIMQPTTFFSHKKLLEVGLLDENLHYTMDWDLWCKFSKIGKVHYEKKLIAANREHAYTKTNSGGLARLKEVLRLQFRHKTTFWPNAFWGYTAAEIQNKSLNFDNQTLRVFGNFLSLLISYLSPSAAIYGLRNVKNSILFGFKPHSTIIPSGKGEIHIPLTGVEDKFELNFELEKEPLLIYVNGIYTDSCIYTLIIDNAFHERKVLPILLEFKTKTGVYSKGVIKNMKMYCKKHE